MSETVDKYRDLVKSLPDGIRLIAVSKTKPEEEILGLYQQGHRDFGENKVQELVSKAESLPKDINWHMVGHLQRNKVKYIAPFVSLIHGVDSLRLLETIQKEGEKKGRVLNCLLQVHIAEEETKYGFSEDELVDVLNAPEIKEFTHLRILGLMGMATFSEDMVKVRKEFRKLKAIFDTVKSLPGADPAGFKELSMGMSSDYQVAIEEGATLIRIGSLIFGERNYS